MISQSPRDRPGLALWLASVTGLAALLVVALVGPLARATWGSPQSLFWLVVLGAGACYLGAAWTLVVGWRARVAEVAILGAALMVQSGLALVHGLLAPGVLRDASAAVSTSIFLSLPMAFAAAFPLIAPERLGAPSARHWRAWTLGWVAAGAGLAGWLLVAPDALPAARQGDPVVMATAAACLAAALTVSWRQLQLYWIGRRPASLVASIAVASLGLSGLVWIGHADFSPGWWLAHVLDIAGVLGASIALAIGHRRDRLITDVLAPVLAREPLVALRLGLSPVVHTFVADLHDKDPLTRDHVVRVAEIAMRAGTRAGLPPARLRWLGLGAILHDVGKLATPTQILTKPGRLTDAETATIREHAAHGAQVLTQVPELAPAARFVRAHHERVDGNGYPDGLDGDRIPLEARIISVCDAYDAMAHSRVYRKGMGPERAVAILREHAGSQWDADCVELVVAAIQQDPSTTVLGDVGTGAPAASHAPVCHALPTR